MTTQINSIPFTDVSTTMFLTLYARVVESRSRNPIITDPKAEEVVAQINDSLLASDVKLLQRLAHFKLRNNMTAYAALRAKQFDLYAQEFMRTYPECTLVNLGCGLDTRFWRVDNGSIQFFDLDLPEVIRFKRGLLRESDRYKMVGCSILDPTWISMVLSGGRPTLFLAEGLFMYLPPAQVQEVLTQLAQRVRAGQLVAEVMHEKYTRGFNRKLVAFKFKYELGFDGAPAYQFGIRHSSDLEAWSPNLHFMDDWFYLDTKHKKLGMLCVFRRLPYFRYTQWCVRYRIGE
jgi:methyltransferase (TIGR00027 family)